MRDNQIHNVDTLKQRRKKLRGSLTPAEAFLWKRIQNSQLGKKFRRQHSVGPYILDLYCSSEKLAIELDGMPHFTEEASEKDKERTDYLNSLGIQVLRFENWKLFEQTEFVLNEIWSKFKC